MELPKMNINIDHYPDYKCKNCGNIIFRPDVRIKFNPLNTQEFWLIPVYACTQCFTILDMTVLPKKHKQ